MVMGRSPVLIAVDSFSRISSVLLILGLLFWWFLILGLFLLGVLSFVDLGVYGGDGGDGPPACRSRSQLIA